MDWGFKKIPFTLDTYVLVAKILQNGAKFRYTKAGFKNYRNLNYLDKQWKVKKNWNLMGFIQKNSFLQLKHVHWCVDSPNYLCHFWNHTSFYTTQLCIFLAQTLHTFYKSSPLEWEFSDFPLLGLKVHQIPHVIFQIKIQFFSKVLIFFSVMRDNSFILLISFILSQYFFKLCITLQCHEPRLFCTFASNFLYALTKRIRSKCTFSDFQLLAWKLIKFLMSFFKSQVSFPLNFVTPFIVMTHNSLKISNWNIICFEQKEPMNVQFFRLLGALVKVYPIPHVIFEKTRSGFIQILHHGSVSQNISALYFFSSNLIYLGQK